MVRPLLTMVVASLAISILGDGQADGAGTANSDRFEHVLQERFALDQERPQPRMDPLLRRIVDAFSEWYDLGLRTTTQPAFWDHPMHAVRAFCLRRMVTGCSWFEVNTMLRGVEATKLEMQAETSPHAADVRVRWVGPTHSMQSSVPTEDEQECERVPHMDAATFLSKHVARSRPFILTQDKAVKNWTAMRNWDRE